MKGDRIFLDTNIIVYAYDVSAGNKNKTAAGIMAQLWETGLGVISTQVLQEFYVTVTSKIPKPVDPKSAGEIVSDLLRWDTIVNDGESILEAIDIQSESGLSFWDSMIITAAVSGGAAHLFTEDLNDGQMIRGIKVTNPF